MRILVHATFPHGPFNAAVRDGSTGQKLEALMADLQPEAVYFTETDGKRSMIMIVDLPQASDVPKIAEPLFLGFEADVKFQVCMTPEDLGNAGLEELGKKWG